LGFRPKLGRHVRARLGFLAGTDHERATDLMAMFTDRTVKAIICLRGGYGSARLLDRLDYEVIRQNPKILCGYSDITSLHCALLVKSKLVGFHGPMLNGELADPKVPVFTRESFFRAVAQPQAAGSVRQGYAGDTVSILHGGMAEGRLIGGNLSLLCASLGTPYAPAFKGRILFFEDVSEKPYRLDRLLTQLLNAGIFAQVAGVAVGINKDCDDPNAKPGGEYRQTGADVLQERLSTLRVPVVTGLPFGHLNINATIPVGVKARLDGEHGDLIITEPAVS
jgi:muramoyltetrapeptide carboxypeptidase